MTLQIGRGKLVVPADAGQRKVDMTEYKNGQIVEDLLEYANWIMEEYGNE